MIYTFIDYFKTMMHNPVYGSMVTLWITGATAWILRNVPFSIYNNIKKQLTTSLVVTDSGYSNIIKHYNGLLKWVLNRKGVSTFCRSFMLRTSDLWGGENDNYFLGIGYTTTYFIYERRLFWIKQSKLESSGSEKIKTEIVVTGLTRNKNLIEKMVKEFSYKKTKNEIYVNMYTSDGWEVVTPIVKRELKTVIMDEDVKNNIVSDIDYFLQNKKWFYERGLPYKKTFIFHGKPGTGKTSFIKALASHFNKNIYLINISTMSNSTFEKSITSAPSGSFIVIEDFDSCEATHSREDKTSSNDEFSVIESDGSKDTNGISLTTILNTLDGIVSLDGNMIFMTTNHIEKIDEALLRKGRVDETYEIKYLKLTLPKLYFIYFCVAALCFKKNTTFT